MMPIDYVIPFVDSSDREWVGTYRKYAPTDCSWYLTRFRERRKSGIKPCYGVLFHKKRQDKQKKWATDVTTCLFRVTLYMERTSCAPA